MSTRSKLSHDYLAIPIFPITHEHLTPVSYNRPTIQIHTQVHTHACTHTKLVTCIKHETCIVYTQPHQHSKSICETSMHFPWFNLQYRVFGTRSSLHKGTPSLNSLNAMLVHICKHAYTHKCYEFNLTV